MALFLRAFLSNQGKRLPTQQNTRAHTQMPNAPFARSQDILYKAVQEFVAEHISDAAIQEEIWRKQFAKQLFAIDNRASVSGNALKSFGVKESDEPCVTSRANCESA